MKYFAFYLAGILAVIGYNVFLIQRDSKLFHKYDQMTLHERYCAQVKEWHPDCKLE